MSKFIIFLWRSSRKSFSRYSVHFVRSLPVFFVLSFQQQVNLPRFVHENVIVSLAPLLEKNYPSPEICDFFSRVGVSARQADSRRNALHDFSIVVIVHVRRSLSKCLRPLCKEFSSIIPYVGETKHDRLKVETFLRVRRTSVNTRACVSSCKSIFWPWILKMMVSVSYKILSRGRRQCPVDLSCPHRCF